MSTIGDSTSTSRPTLFSTPSFIRALGSQLFPNGVPFIGGAPAKQTAESPSLVARDISPERPDETATDAKAKTAATPTLSHPTAQRARGPANRQPPSRKPRAIINNATSSVAQSTLPSTVSAPGNLTEVRNGVVAQVPQIDEVSATAAVVAAPPVSEAETPPPAEGNNSPATETPKSEPNCIMKFLNLLLWLITFGQCGHEENNEIPQN